MFKSRFISFTHNTHEKLNEVLIFNQVARNFKAARLPSSFQEGFGFHIMTAVDMTERDSTSSHNNRALNSNPFLPNHESSYEGLQQRITVIHSCVFGMLES